MATPSKFIPHEPWKPDVDPLESAERFRDTVAQRRSVRHFSSEPVDRAIIETIVAAAGSAPSGANKQPWRFVAISDPDLKHRIREAAEAEERLFYEGRASEDWLQDLEPLEVGPDKPFLDEAPWLVAIFKLMEDDRPGSTGRVYYVNESVGMAAGLFLAAAQQAGLATLTHTPSPMGFLGKILKRPSYERPVVLIPVGWPAEHCTVPDITRKPLDEILVWREGDGGNPDEPSPNTDT